MKGTNVMIELLRTAQKEGYKADYVLFDSWFSTPAQLIAVKDLDLDSSREHLQGELWLCKPSDCLFLLSFQGTSPNFAMGSFS